MLKRMVIDNFTVFGHAELEFGQLNVIHGENGTGKTHLLKLVHHIYKLCATAPAPAETRLDDLKPVHDWIAVDKSAHALLQEAFGFDDREELVRFGHPAAKFSGKDELDRGMTVRITAASIDTTYGPRGLLPWSKRAIYVPAQDVLTKDPAWLPFSRDHILREETLGIELRLQLMQPRLRELPETALAVLRGMVEGIGWTPEVDRQGDVYLKKDGQRVPARMAALGHVKLALPALLVERFGVQSWSLMWDEPEANLNPRLIKVVAKALVDLAAAGVQVFVATHSLFLLRELELLSSSKAGKSFAWRHFGLLPGTNGVQVRQGDTAADAGSPAALDESLEQSDRYLQWEG